MSTKERLKRYFIFNYFISAWHCIKGFFAPKIWDDKTAIIKAYNSKIGNKQLDIENPVLFSEKIQWYKLNHRDPLMQKCADKIDVRDYIAEKGYADILNEQYATYSKVKDIDFSKLPEKFVIKSSHGTAQIIIVKDKKELNVCQSKLMMSTWLHQDIYWRGREWVYKDIPKRIVVEKYLEDNFGGLTDYKFFCFNGEPKFMQYEFGRYENEHFRNFYDMDWNLLPFGKDIPYNKDVNIEKPVKFDEMKRIAKDLSQDFQFVRVDLYQVNGKIYFGELTFFPAGGNANFNPPEYDEVVGNMWKLVQ